MRKKVNVVLIQKSRRTEPAQGFDKFNLDTKCRDGEYVGDREFLIITPNYSFKASDLLNNWAEISLLMNNEKQHYPNVSLHIDFTEDRFLPYLEEFKKILSEDSTVDCTII
jgi:hypothetical protein